MKGMFCVIRSLYCEFIVCILRNNFNLSSFQQRFYKKAAAFVLRAVAKHSPQLAQSVVDCGAVDALVVCLEDFDPGVKEAAAWALGYVARHNAGMPPVMRFLYNKTEFL